MAQTIALAAFAYGLGSCIMIRAVNWPDMLREMLGIPESKLIMVGIAVGYPDPNAPANSYERHRDPLTSLSSGTDLGKYMPRENDSGLSNKS